MITRISTRVCYASLVRKGVAAFVLCLGYAVACLMITNATLTAWGFLLQTYVPCLSPLLLFIGACLMPPCAKGRGNLMAVTAVSLGTAPFLTWESQMQDAFPALVLNCLLAVAAFLLSICLLSRMMDKARRGLYLNPYLKSLAYANYWFCLVCVVIPVFLILSVFLGILSESPGHFLRNRPQAILMMLQECIPFAINYALPMTVAIQALLCGIWATLAFWRLKPVRNLPQDIQQSDAIHEPQE